MTASQNGHRWLTPWAVGFMGGALLAIASTGAMSYAAFWRDGATRTEVRNVEVRVETKLGDMERRITEVSERLASGLADFRTESQADRAAIRTKVDTLLSEWVRLRESLDSLLSRPQIGASKN